MRLKTAENWSALGDQIRTDLTELAEILPARELGESGKWRKVIKYFRGRYLVQDSSGIWRKRDFHLLDKAVENQADKDKARNRTTHMLIDLFDNGRFGDLSKTSAKAEIRKSRSLADLCEYDPSNDSNLEEIALAPPEGELRKLRIANGLIGNSAIKNPKMHQLWERLLQLLSLINDNAEQHLKNCNEMLESMICDAKAALENDQVDENITGWLFEEVDPDVDGRQQDEFSDSD
jgi:hypothetical protein